MKCYDVSRLPSMIELGHDGENNWRPNSFDCSALLKNHPNGVITLWLLPNGESQAFPVAVERDGNTIVWTPLSEEMTAEYGTLQIHCVDGSDVGKSDTAQYHVKDSIVPGAEHPAAVPSWAARVVEATGHYPKIINGNWYVWDVQNGEWSDTGVSAGGDVSPEQLAEAIEEYFDEHPIQAPVQSVNGKTGAVNLSASDVHALPDSYTPPVESVNGKTGAVVLDAEDVGALPADTPIPAAVTEQTVAGWGFTKNTGTYTKPSSGIPKTDLASDVQTSLGKADTALQEHQSLSEYATETYVQQQIAAIPAELPAVTASDNGKFLRVVNGAWAAATVPTAESNSFGGGS